MKKHFVVYQIRDVHEFSDFSTIRGLFELTKCDTKEEAESVIKMYRKDNQNYTILEVYSI